MKTTLQVKLLPSPEQHELLLDTMHAFNAACTWIAAYAYQERCASKFVLQKALYQEIRQRFTLSAQLAIRAIAKVVEAYKRDKNTPLAFRPTGAVVYDERILSFQGLDFASLMTIGKRVIVPLQMGAYQQVQFHRAKGQADLILVDGQFFLLITIDTPEEPPMEPTRFLGVDLGIIELATDSDGNSYTGTPVEKVRQRCGTARQTYQEQWQEATIEALVCYSAPSHRPKTVWAAWLSLIELPPAEPELNPAERVFEELRRAVKRAVYGTIEDTMAAVDRELTSVTGSHVRIRRLVG